MVKYKQILPTIFPNAEELNDNETVAPLQSFIEAAFRWKNDKFGDDYWRDIWEGKTSITIDHINHIYNFYKDKKMLHRYIINDYDFGDGDTVGNILNNYFEFKNREEVEIL